MPLRVRIAAGIGFMSHEKTSRSTIHNYLPHLVRRHNPHLRPWNIHIPRRVPPQVKNKGFLDTLRLDRTMTMDSRLHQVTPSR